MESMLRDAKNEGDKDFDGAQMLMSVVVYILE